MILQKSYRPPGPHPVQNSWLRHCKGSINYSVNSTYTLYNIPKYYVIYLPDQKYNRII